MRNHREREIQQQQQQPMIIIQSDDDKNFFFEPIENKNSSSHFQIENGNNK